MKKIILCAIILPLLLANCMAHAQVILGDPVKQVTSAAAESSHVIKASGGLLYGLSVTTGAVAGYVMVFDATTAPADGAVVPKNCYAVAANSTVAVSNAQYPAPFSTGIVVVFSSTGCFSKTASSTAFFNVQAI